jgi:hypothetical protein
VISHQEVVVSFRQCLQKNLSSFPGLIVSVRIDQYSVILVSERVNPTLGHHPFGWPSCRHLDASKKSAIKITNGPEMVGHKMPPNPIYIANE